MIAGTIHGVTIGIGFGGIILSIRYIDHPGKNFDHRWTRRKITTLHRDYPALILLSSSLLLGVTLIAVPCGVTII